MKTATRTEQARVREGNVHDVHRHHAEVVAGIKEEMDYVLQNSAQPVSIYLDDHHKTGNLALAQLLGYATVEDYEKSNLNFVEAYIAEKSQEAVVDNYHTSFKQQLKATVIDVTIKNLTGDEKVVQFIHVPMMYDGHLFAVSFINE